MSTGLIPPKKNRGKGSQGKKDAVTPKKKSSISAGDNIIPEHDVALELGKSMSLIEAEVEEAARRVHATHKRLVTVSDEFDPEPARRPIGSRRPSGVVFIDTSRMSKKKSLDPSQKLKGIQTLTSSDESTCIFTTSNKGNGIKPGVPNEVKGSSEAKVDSVIDWGSENKSEHSEGEKVDKEEIEWLSTDEGEKKQNDDDDDRSIFLKETNDEDEYAEYKA
ncbi:hypothetical protein Tco_0710813 [Tanacetum coccineum]